MNRAVTARFIGQRLQVCVRGIYWNVAITDRSKDIREWILKRMNRLAPYCRSAGYLSHLRTKMKPRDSKSLQETFFLLGLTFPNNQLLRNLTMFWKQISGYKKNIYIFSNLSDHRHYTLKLNDLSTKGMNDSTARVKLNYARMFVEPDIRYFLISGRISDSICRISGQQVGFYQEEQNTVEQTMRTSYNQTFFRTFSTLRKYEWLAWYIYIYFRPNFWTDTGTNLFAYSSLVVHSSGP